MKKLIFFFLVSTFALDAQEVWKDKFSFAGNVRDLRSISFAPQADLSLSSFLNARMDASYFWTDRFSLNLGVRNRLFYGQSIASQQPFLANFLDTDPGYLDLSFVLIEGNFAVDQLQADRLYLDYSTEHWEMRLGRQRINWGINLVWNPHDLFNTFNFTDFDYEKRSGVDALRIQHHLKDYSTIDVAFQVDSSFDGAVLAGLYKFNRKEYDLQMLGGWYKGDLALGFGWAGSIKQAGFKGESTLFVPIASQDTVRAVSISMAWDYTLKKGTYLMGSILYNSLGGNTGNASLETLLLNQTLSPKRLMPNRYSVLLQVSQPLSPLWSAAFTALYGFGIDLLFAMPSISYNLREDLDLQFVSQLGFAPDANDIFSFLGGASIVRLKWSF